MSGKMEFGAICNCGHLHGIEIPKNVEDVHYDAFCECGQLENIMGNDSIVIVDNCYLIRNKKLISISKEMEEYIIPSGVEVLGYGVFKNNLDAKTIVVPNTVTEFESDAFYNCANLTSLTLSNKLTKIGDRCFQNCESLTTLHIPDTVTTVGNDIMDGCSSLTNLYLSKNIEFDDRTFDLLTDAKVVVENGLRYQGNILLGPQDLTLESCVVREGTMIIAKNAFLNCYNLKSVKLPESLLYIQDNAFQNCALKSLTLPKNVREIGDFAFQWAISTNSLIIPSSVKVIKSYAFSGCKIDNIEFEGDVESIEDSVFNLTFQKRFVNFTFHSANLPTVKRSFSCWSWYAGRPNDINIYVQDAIYEKKEEIGQGWEQYTDKLIPLSQKNDTETRGGYIFNEENGELTIYGKAEIATPLWEGCKEKTKKVIIADEVQYLCEMAFWEFTNLKEVVLGKGLITIGGWAFKGCTSLTSITIPDSVTKIGRLAFCGCENLTNITIGENVKIIEEDAFEGCSNLRKVDISDLSAWCNIDFEKSELIDNSTNPLEYAKKLYLNGKEIENLIIPSNITKIKRKTFSGCESITSITIHNNVTEIGEYAFEGCSNLRKVNISDLYAWCNINFEDNPLLNKGELYLNGKLIKGDLAIPYGVTSIGTGAFHNCGEITSVTIPDSVISIGSNAFSYCTNLTSITIPSSVTSIGDYAFYWSNELKNVYIFDLLVWCNISFEGRFGHPLEKDGSKLFCNGEEIKIITLPEGITEIKPYQFFNCDNLTEINIPKGVTKIGEYAFYDCDNLTKLNIPDGVTEIDEYAFWLCGKLENFNIPNSVTKIGTYAFCGCDGLTSITIPDSVTSIGTMAFNCCVNLTSITIGNGITELDNGIFMQCEDIKEINVPEHLLTESLVRRFGSKATINGVNYNQDGLIIMNNKVIAVVEQKEIVVIPDGITTFDATFIVESDYIDGQWHKNCILREIVIPKSVTTISNRFGDCNNLEKVRYKGDVSDWCKIDFISNGSFYNEEMLHHGVKLYFNDKEVTDLVIPSDVTEIKGSAFSGYDGLTSVTIPDSVTSIGEAAFYGCTSLTSITIPSSVTSIGGAAFYGCSGLKEIISEKDFEFNEGLYSFPFEECTNVTHVKGSFGLLHRHVYESTGDYDVFNFPNLETCEFVDGPFAEFEREIFYWDWFNERLKNEDGLTYFNEVLVAAYDTHKEHYVVKEGTKYICEEAFSGCDSAISITLPKTLVNCCKLLPYKQKLYTKTLRPFYMSEIKDCEIEINGKTKDELKEILFKYETLYKSEKDANGHIYEYGQIIINDDLLNELGTSLYDTIILLKMIGSKFYKGTISLIIDTNVNCDLYLKEDEVLEAICYWLWYLEEIIFSNKTELKTIISKGSYYNSYGNTDNKPDVKSITLPNSVEFINKNKLQHFNKLEKIVVNDINDWLHIDLEESPLTLNEGGVKLYVGENEYNPKEFTIPADNTEIKSRTFENWTNLETIRIHKDVTKIGMDAFDGCTSLKEVIYEGDYDAWGRVIFGGLIKIGSANLYIDGKKENDNRTAVINGIRILGSEELVIKEGTKVIRYGEFANNKIITKVHIPDSVVEIQESAFRGCISLMEVIMPNGIKEIWNIFYECENLSKINIPSSVTSISGGFNSCTSLERVDISDLSAWCNIKFSSSTSNPLCNGDKLYLNEVEITDLVIPSDVTEIKDYAFAGYKNLTSVIIPNSVTSIGKSAFADCSRLTSVTIGNSVTSIGSNAFQGCSSLTSVTIPDSVTSIGDGAFYNCGNLTSITIPDDVTRIGNNAFEGCSGLHTVSIGKNVTEVGEDAFWKCDNISEITFKNSKCNFKLNSTYGKPYNGDAICYIHIDSIESFCEENYFYKIGGTKNLIYENEKVEELVIPDTVNKICNNCFENFSFKKVVMGDSTSLTVGEEAFKNAHIKDLEITNIQNWCKISFNGYDSNPLYVISSSVSQHLPIIKDVLVYSNVFPYYSELRIPEGIEEISNCTFTRMNADIIKLPNSLKRIGDYAFYDSSFRNIQWGSGLEEIGDNAFQHFFYIEKEQDFVLPNGLKKIGKYAFSNGYVETIIMSDSVEEIGEYCFSRCNNLKKVHIGNGLKSIPDYAFYNCRELNNINFKEDECQSLTRIGKKAFDMCVDFSFQKILTLPNSITSIDDYAFGATDFTFNRTFFKEIKLPNSLTTLGHNIFGGCSMLEKIEIPKSLTTMQYDSLIGINGILGKFDGDCKYITPDRRCIIYDNKLLYFAPCELDENGKVIHDVRHNKSYINSYTFPNSWGIVDINGDVLGSGVNKIVLPHTLIEIPDKCFYSNSHIDTIVIADGSFTNRIGESAFENCGDLKGVFISGSVNTIDKHAFCLFGTDPDDKETGTTKNLSLFLNNDTPPYIHPEAFKVNGGVRKDMDLNIFVKDEASRINFINNESWEPFADYIKVLKFEHKYMSFSFDDLTLTINVDKNNNIIGKNNLVFNFDEGIRPFINKVVVTNRDNTSYSVSYFPDFISLNEVEFAEGLTEIHGGMFEGSGELYKVTLPKSCKKISDRAFKWCFDLDEINLENIEEIEGECHFWGCDLREVRLTNKNLKHIPELAFYHCESLLSVYLGENVSSIGDNAFEGCLKLKAINLESTSVETIGGGAFCNCTSLSNVLFPVEKIKYIGGQAFRGTSIAEIYIPNSVREIEYLAFGGCNLLKTVKNMHKDIERLVSPFGGSNNIEEMTGDLVVGGKYLIKDRTLYHYITNKEKNIIIPSDVDKLCDYCFAHNKIIESVDLNGVITINAYTFSGCKSLTDVKNTENVIYVGDYAFASCENLKEIMFKNESITFGTAPFSNTQIERFDFSSSEDGLCLIRKYPLKDEYKLISFIPNNTKVKEYETPEKIAKICSFAFASEETLEKLVLGGDVNEIDYYGFNSCIIKEIDMTQSNVEVLLPESFRYCSFNIIRLSNNTKTIYNYSLAESSIKTLYCECDVPPVLEEWAFTFRDTIDFHIYVPSSLVGTYKSADGWKKYKNNISAIQE